MKIVIIRLDRITTTLRVHLDLKRFYRRNKVENIYKQHKSREFIALVSYDSIYYGQWGIESGGETRAMVQPKGLPNIQYIHNTFLFVKENFHECTILFQQKRIRCHSLTEQFSNGHETSLPMYPLPVTLSLLLTP